MTSFNRRKTDPKTPEDVFAIIRKTLAANTPVILSPFQQGLLLDYVHDANAMFLRFCISQIPEASA